MQPRFQRQLRRQLGRPSRRFDPNQFDSRKLRDTDNRRYLMDWQLISTAPFDRDLELAVIGYDGVHALVFPCRRILGSWINAETKKRIDVWPTHWRAWQERC